MLYVYGLVDPDTKRVRYIGLTNNPKKRHRAHIDQGKRLRAKYGALGTWIGSLHDQGREPELVILDEGDDDAMVAREAELVRSARLLNEDLTNGKHGTLGYRNKRSKTVTPEEIHAPQTITPEEIHALRESHGWSRAELARRIGVPYATLYAWEQGRRTPTGLYRERLELFARQNADYRDTEINVGVEGKHIADIPGGFIYDASAPDNEEE